MAYKIIDGCVGCGSCYEVCPFDALERHDPDAATTTYSIRPKVCRECDLCVDACPVNVIVPDDSTPHRKRIVSLVVNQERCVGCSLCMRHCPVGAVTGVIKKPFVIDENRCIKCGECVTVCRKNGFDVVYAEAQ